MMRIALAVITTIELVSFTARAQEVVRLSVATSAQEKIFDKIEAGFTKETGIKLSYTKSARRQPTDYFRDVLEGRSDAAVASVSYEDWLALMKEEKVAIPDGADITQRTIGRDLMKIIAHESTKAKKLSLAEVSSVFTGKVKNWKSITGADVPIQLIAAEDRKDKAPFRKFAMNNAEFAKEMKAVPTLPDLIKTIGATSGAIGFYAVKAELPAQVIEVETSPIGRPVTMITHGRPKPAVEALIKYLREKGQQ